MSEQSEAGDDTSLDIGRVRRLLRLLRSVLPTGTTEPDQGYTGILSYSTEWHALIIGIVAGITANTTGHYQVAFGLVTIALGVGRANQQASEAVQAQLVKEPWYFFVGVGIGFVLPMILGRIEVPVGIA